MINAAIILLPPAIAIGCHSINLIKKPPVLHKMAVHNRKIMAVDFEFMY
jgi:hypothetical protein